MKFVIYPAVDPDRLARLQHAVGDARIVNAIDEREAIRDIADAAGLSLGAAYYYFKSKEALVGAYYEFVQQEHQARPQQAQDDPQDRDQVQTSEGVGEHGVSCPDAARS